MVVERTTLLLFFFLIPEFNSDFYSFLYGGMVAVVWSVGIVNKKQHIIKSKYWYFKSVLYLLEK